MCLLRAQWFSFVVTVFTHCLHPIVWPLLAIITIFVVVVSIRNQRPSGHDRTHLHFICGTQQHTHKLQQFTAELIPTKRFLYTSQLTWVLDNKMVKAFTELDINKNWLQVIILLLRPPCCNLNLTRNVSTLQDTSQLVVLCHAMEFGLNVERITQINAPGDEAESLWCRSLTSSDAVVLSRCVIMSSRWDITPTSPSRLVCCCRDRPSRSMSLVFSRESRLFVSLAGQSASRREAAGRSRDGSGDRLRCRLADEATVRLVSRLRFWSRE